MHICGACHVLCTTFERNAVFPDSKLETRGASFRVYEFSDLSHSSSGRWCQASLGGVIFEERFDAANSCSLIFMAPRQSCGVASLNEVMGAQNTPET